MSKQLRIEQILRQGAAVDGHKWLLRSAAGGMQRIGYHLFAGTGFTGDEHRNIPIPNALHHIQNLLHRLTGGDDRFEFFAPIKRQMQPLHLLPQRLALKHLIDPQHQFTGVDRFGQIVIGAQSHRLDRRFNAAVGGHHDALCHEAASLQAV